MGLERESTPENRTVARDRTTCSIFELFQITQIIRPSGGSQPNQLVDVPPEMERNGKYRITAVLLGLPVIPNTNIRTKWLFEMVIQNILFVGYPAHNTTRDRVD